MSGGAGRSVLESTGTADDHAVLQEEETASMEFNKEQSTFYDTLLTDITHGPKKYGERVFLYCMN